MTHGATASVRRRAPDSLAPPPTRGAPSTDAPPPSPHAASASASPLADTEATTFSSPRGGGRITAGLVVCFPNYSTSLSFPGLYVEDIFVRASWRRRSLMLSVVAGKAAELGMGAWNGACLTVIARPQSRFKRRGLCLTAIANNKRGGFCFCCYALVLDMILAHWRGEFRIDVKKSGPGEGLLLALAKLG
ncbi:hypothetical protein BS78_09G241500 [Paspalum vaginatum]|nr:hypothetical protein BS78_09G241500 [Paspalum vaginatum]